MQDEYAISVKDLSFGYQDTLLMDHVSFSVGKGDFAAIIGSNGTGKSTMIKLLLGLLSPTDGEIYMLGEKVEGPSHSARIGYVPQNGGSNASRFPATAMELVMSSLYPQIGFLRFPRRKHREAALDALKQVGMQSHANSLMSELSGGQQQRVMLARVLVNDPSVLLLDEPTVGIDQTAVASLMEILHTLNIERRVTILMVTHELYSVAPYLNRVLCLSDKNFAEDEIPDGILVHAHAGTHESTHEHVHCAACEDAHDPAHCSACDHIKESGVEL